jgi:hypothetical protein
MKSICRQQSEQSASWIEPRLTAEAKGRQDDIERTPPGPHQTPSRTIQRGRPRRGIVAGVAVRRLRGSQVHVSYHHRMTLADLYSNREG